MQNTTPRHGNKQIGGLRGEFVGATRGQDILDAEFSIMERRQQMSGGGKTKTKTKTTKKDDRLHNSLKNSAEEFTVVFKADNIYGTTVSKSFPKISQGGKHGNYLGRDTEQLTISIASFRVVSVVSTSGKSKFAQFLVVFSRGGVKHTRGIWKRHSNFKTLFDRCSGGGGWRFSSCKNDDKEPAGKNSR